MRNIKNKKIFVVALVITVLVVGYFLIFYKKALPAEAGWFDESWYYRKVMQIDYTKIDAELTNFPVAVQFNATNNIYANTNDDGSDLRFTDIDGNLLKYEIEKWDETATSTVWVKIPTVHSEATTNFYIYYGNPSALDAQEPAQVWDDDYVGVWHMSTSTVGVIDSTNNNDGINNGADIISSDGVGYGLDFNGSSDYVNLGQMDSYEGQEFVTFEAYFRVDTDNDDFIIMGKAGLSNMYPMIWRDDSAAGSGRLNTMSTAITGSSNRLEFAQDSLNDTSWHYVSIVFDGNNQQLRGYLDGTEDANSPVATGLSTFPTSVNDLWLGGADSFSYWLDGVISEARISKSIRSAAWVKASYNNINNTLLTEGSEEQGPGPVMYLSFDEGYGQTAYDSSPNNNDGTLGLTSSNESDDPDWTTDAKFGKAMFYDGNDLVSASTTGMSNTAGTVSAWVKNTDTANAEKRYIFSHGNGGVDNRIYMFKGVNGNLYISLGGFSDYDQGWAFDANQWYNVQLVWDSGSYSTYVDGVFIKSGTYSSLNTIQDSAYVGAYRSFGGTVSEEWMGYIDEVKVYNYARTADQIKQDYNKGFAVMFGANNPDSSLSDGLVGYWPMDESASSTCDTALYDSCDASGNGNDGNWFGDTTATSTAKFGRGMEYDGNSDYFYIDNNSSLDFTGDDFTFAFWMKRRTLNTSQCILTKGDSGGRDYYICLADTNKLYIGGDTPGNIFSNGTIADTDTFHHVVITRKDLNTTIYIDAEKDSENKLTSFSNRAFPVEIGRTNRYSVYFDGMLDEFRIYNRALSPEEVRHLYEWAPGPVAHWKFDEKSGTTAYDTAASSTFSGGNHGTLTNSPVWDRGKIGGALRFDGDAVAKSVAPKVDLGRSFDFPELPFTVMAWINPTDWDKYRTIIGKRDSYSAANMRFQWQFYITNGNMFIGSSAGSRLFNYAPPLKQWTHLAVQVGVDSTDLYVNGVFQETKAAVVLGTDATAASAIGTNGEAADTDPFDGYIDDVKIYNYIRTPRQIMEDMNAGQRNNPIGYWSFDEGQGTTAYDSGVSAGLDNGNNGTLTNMSTSGTSTAWVAGKSGKALRFDGVDDYVTITDDPSLESESELSISVWVKPDIINQNRAIIIKSESGQRSWALTQSTELIRLYVADAIGDTSNWVTTNSNYLSDTSKWYYITAVYNGNESNQDNMVKIYVDGELVPSTVNGTIPSTLTDSTAEIGIGKGVFGTYSSFDGLIDEVKVYNYALTLDEIRENYNQGKQTVLSKTKEEVANTYEGLVGWWKMDESSWSGATDEVIDYSGLGNHGTATNAVATSTAKFGRAGEFNGTNSYISIPDDSSLDMVDEISICSWYYDPGDANDYLVSKSSASWTYNLLIIDSSQQLKFRINQNDLTYPENSVIGGLDEFTGKWVYLCGTYGDMEMRLYVNGVLKNSAKIDEKINTNSDPVFIGAQNSSGNYFNSIIDDVKIWNIALTPDEIMREYTEMKPPVAHWKFDEKTGTSAVDSSGMGNTGTITSATWGSSADCKFGACLDFDGSGDYINAGSGENLDDLGPLSISTWAYFRPGYGESSVNPIVAKTNSSLSDPAGSWDFDVSNSGQLRFGKDFNTTDIVARCADVISTDSWKHLVMTWNGGNDSSQDIAIYIDGEECSSYDINIDGAGAPVSDASNNLYIGNGIYNNRTVDGRLDDVKIYDYVLTPRQIAQEYNGGAPVGYWKFDEGEGGTAHDASGNKNHGTIHVGTGGSNTATSSMWSNGTSGKVNGSLDFDGTDDYVDVGDIDYSSFNDNISISAWVKPSNLSSNDFILSTYNGSTGMYFDFYNNNHFQWEIASTEHDYEGKFNTGEWYHLTGTYNKEEVVLYVNGEEVLREAETDPIETFQTTYIGKSVSGGPFMFDGQIDEVKVWNYALTPEDVKKEYNGGFSTYFK